MFFRRKKNKSGSYSVQVLQTEGRTNKLIKTIGSSKIESELVYFEHKAQCYIYEQSGQLLFDFHTDRTRWMSEVNESIQDVQLIGPELILGKIYDQIGFNAIEGELFRDLVISRLVYPFSKLKTIRYLAEYRGVSYSPDQIYRYLDKFYDQQKELAEQISFEHTLSILNQDLSVVFYDVTTLHFEIDKEDDFRKTGFSKQGKHKHPQILLGLLVSIDGYPLAYELFEGSKYEGHTMLDVVNKFIQRFGLKRLIIVADSGLMTKANISSLIEDKHEFILGARIKNESNKIKSKILNLKLKNGQSKVINKTDQLRLIINYSSKRAKKDESNRIKGLKRLEKSLASGKLTKSNINNRGYNKYLRLNGSINVTIDYDKFKADKVWDGLKGYITNSSMKPKDLISNYRELWKIEKAFRVAKSDLNIRPFYHRKPKRIQAHTCIAFVAYKVYKELDRLLKGKKAEISVDRTLELLKTIYAINLTDPISKKQGRIIITKMEQQKKILRIFEIKPNSDFE